MCTLLPLKLRTVERSIHPGTDAKVMLLPAACIISVCSLMSDADLLRHVNQLAKLFVEFFMHKNYGRTTLEDALLVYVEFHSLEAQSSGTRSIPSNAAAYTFVGGLAVTMDFCAPWCASQPWWCSTTPQPRVGSSFKGQAWPSLPWERMKERSLLGVVVGYSRQKVIQCRGLEPSWRLWIQKMMLSLHLVLLTKCGHVVLLTLRGD